MTVKPVAKMPLSSFSRTNSYHLQAEVIGIFGILRGVALLDLLEGVFSIVIDLAALHSFEGSLYSNNF